ncbi:MAG TPA: hypothetical protein PLR50_13180, partial [Candidatus Rifleibacterium sp.]|nr:hypothetical protein [Candidatus Rifleibacterium sp.]
GHLIVSRFVKKIANTKYDTFIVAKVNPKMNVGANALKYLRFAIASDSRHPLPRVQALRG